MNQGKRALLLAVLSLLCLGSAAGFRVHPLGRTHGPDDEFANATLIRTERSLELRLRTRVVKMLNVPDVMQATDYTCGPSSLSAVLSYYQITQRESDLARTAKTSPEYGTAPTMLLQTAQSLNLSAELRQGMSISELEYNVNLGRPVIVEIQAWEDDGTPYVVDYDSGHYVVVIGYDEAYLYFEDPWVLGSVAYIAKREFLNRWHDYVHDEARRVQNLGIVVQGPLGAIPVVIRME